MKKLSLISNSHVHKTVSWSSCAQILPKITPPVETIAAGATINELCREKEFHIFPHKHYLAVGIQFACVTKLNVPEIECPQYH